MQMVRVSLVWLLLAALVVATLADCFDTTLLATALEVEAVRDPAAPSCTLWQSAHRTVLGGALMHDGAELLLLSTDELLRYSAADGSRLGDEQLLAAAPPNTANARSVSLAAAPSADAVWAAVDSTVTAYRLSNGAALSTALTQFGSAETRVWLAADDATGVLYVSHGDAVWRVSARDGLLEHVFAAVPGTGALVFDATAQLLYVVMGRPAARVMVFSTAAQTYGVSVATLAVASLDVAALSGDGECLLALDAADGAVRRLACGAGTVSTLASSPLGVGYDALLSSTLALRAGVPVRVQDGQPALPLGSDAVNDGNLAALLYAPVQNTAHTLVLIDTAGTAAEMLVDPVAGCPAQLRALLPTLRGVAEVLDVQAGSGAVLWRNATGAYWRRDAFDLDTAAPASAHSPPSGWLRACVHSAADGEQQVCALDSRGVWCGEQALPLPDELAPSAHTQLASLGGGRLLLAEPYDDAPAVRLFAHNDSAATWTGCDAEFDGFALQWWQPLHTLVPTGEFVAVRWNASTTLLLDARCRLGGVLRVPRDEQTLATAAFGADPRRCTALDHQVIDVPATRSRGWPIYWPVLFGVLACACAAASLTACCAVLNYHACYARCMYGPPRPDGRFRSLEPQHSARSRWALLQGALFRCALTTTHCCPPLYDCIDARFQRKFSPAVTYALDGATDDNSAGVLPHNSSEPPSPAWRQVDLADDGPPGARTAADAAAGGDLLQ